MGLYRTAALVPARPWKCLTFSNTHAISSIWGINFAWQCLSGLCLGKGKLPSLPRVSTESFEVVKEADRTLCSGVPSFLPWEQTTENTAALTQPGVQQVNKCSVGARTKWKSSQTSKGTGGNSQSSPTWIKHHPCLRQCSLSPGASHVPAGCWALLQMGAGAGKCRCTPRQDVC